MRMDHSVLRPATLSIFFAKPAGIDNLSIDEA